MSPVIVELAADRPRYAMFIVDGQHRATWGLPHRVSQPHVSYCQLRRVILVQILFVPRRLLSPLPHASDLKVALVAPVVYGGPCRETNLCLGLAIFLSLCLPSLQ